MGSFRKVLFFISSPFAFGPRTEVAQVRTSQVIDASDGTTRRPGPALAAIPAGSVKSRFGPGTPGPGITHEVDSDFLEQLPLAR